MTPEEREKRLEEIRITSWTSTQGATEAICFLLTELDRVKAKLTDAVEHLNAQAKLLGGLYVERETLKAERDEAWSAGAHEHLLASGVLEERLAGARKEVVRQIEFAEKAEQERDAAFAERDKWIGAALAEVKRTVAMHAVLLESARLEGAKAAQGELADVLAEAKALREAVVAAKTLGQWGEVVAAAKAALAAHPEPKR